MDWLVPIKHKLSLKWISERAIRHEQINKKENIFRTVYRILMEFVCFNMKINFTLNDTSWKLSEKDSLYVNFTSHLMRHQTFYIRESCENLHRKCWDFDLNMRLSFITSLKKFCYMPRHKKKNKTRKKRNRQIYKQG